MSFPDGWTAWLEKSLSISAQNRRSPPDPCTNAPGIGMFSANATCLDSTFGLLIHAASGNEGGIGMPPTNRSGWVSKNDAKTICRWLEQAGVSRSVGMKLTGHKTLSMFTRYNTVDQADAKEAMQRLDDYFNHESADCCHSAASIKKGSGDFS